MMADTFVLRPTALLRFDGDVLAVATMNADEGQAMLVFRDPDEARKYQEHTGKSLPSEGFKRMQLGEEEIDALLDTNGIGYVAMPEPWTGGGGVDLFTAENFLEFLRTSEEVRD